MASGKISKHALPASSILEVVVSMVVIVMVIGIAMMIYTNVMRLSLSERQLRAQVVLQEAILEAEFPKNSQSMDPTSEGWTVEKTQAPYEGGDQLWQIHLTVYDDQHQKISETDKIIIRHESQ